MQWLAAAAGRLSLRSLAVATLIGGHEARAEFEFVPYGMTQVLHDSNVYRVSSSDQARLVDGRPVRSDTIYSSALGLEANYLWGEQKLRTQLEGRRFDYESAKPLSRFEYLFSTGLDWVLLSNVGGSADYMQERKLAALEDRDTSRLVFNLDRRGSLKANLGLGNAWRLEGGYALHDLASPIPAAPDFGLRENTFSTALKYLGVARITAGIGADYVDGRFRGVGDNGSFKQYAGQFTLGYEATGLSSFNGVLGYTRREDPTQGGNTGELTGDFGYKRELTGKTRASIDLFRRVVSYDAGANSVVETGGTAAIDWDATERIAAGLTYSYNTGRFGASNLVGAPNNGRRDRIATAGLNVRYKPLRWLQVKTYGSYQTRQSNLAGASFNDAIAGLELSLRFQ